MLAVAVRQMLSVLFDIDSFLVGTDARSAAADGFPVENIITSDICNGNMLSLRIIIVINVYLSEFLEVGHELFKTTPASYGGHFLSGDVFDPAFLSIAEPSEDVSAALAIDLSSLESLNALHGRVSVINAASLFHLFNEDKQLHLVRSLAGLLSAQPGSVICGSQAGALEKGFSSNNLGGGQLFCHSPRTWTSLWDGEVFQKGSVKVEVELVEHTLHQKKIRRLLWSVIRL